ncbi:hypothetical protein ACA081_00445 [Candidatus Hodgkinia cicadicola]
MLKPNWQLVVNNSVEPKFGINIFNLKLINNKIIIFIFSCIGGNV